MRRVTRLFAVLILAASLGLAAPVAAAAPSAVGVSALGDCDDPGDGGGAGTPPPPCSDLPEWQQRLLATQAQFNARIDGRQETITNPQINDLLDVVQRRFNALFDSLYSR